jgi:hypothetical protein
MIHFFSRKPVGGMESRLVQACRLAIPPKSVSENASF